MSIELCARTVFDIILQFGNVNEFPFLSLTRIFALSLDKISCTSTKQSSKLVVLSSVGIIFE